MSSRPSDTTTLVERPVRGLAFIPVTGSTLRHGQAWQHAVRASHLHAFRPAVCAVSATVAQRPPPDRTSLCYRSRDEPLHRFEAGPARRAVLPLAIGEGDGRPGPTRRARDLALVDAASRCRRYVAGLDRSGGTRA